MREELIKLAEEKGFISENISFLLTLIKSRNKLKIEYWFYLWMCELQKWLMDEKSIFVEPSTYLQENTIDCKWGVAFMYEIVGAQENISEKLPIYKEKMSSYTEALEKGLYKALKILK